MLTAETVGADTSPAFLPDGQHFLYSRVSVTSVRGIFLRLCRRFTGAAEDAKPLIVNQVAGVVYVAQPQSNVGHILFERDGALMAQPFDARRLELVGEATTVSTDLAGGINAGPSILSVICRSDRVPVGGFSGALVSALVRPSGDAAGTGR